MTAFPQDPSELAIAIAGVRSWYHTLELAPGVVTPGWFDHRPIASRLPMPPTLVGRRCLDVGTFDGFWAFEMERRGATVVAIDVLDPVRWDWPAGGLVDLGGCPGPGFAVARAALQSSVEHRELSVYDLDSADIGQFDFVYLGSLLLHLRDPIGALERVRGVCRGRLLVVDAIDTALSARRPHTPTATLDGMGRPWWWKPNLAGLARMVTAAGFRIISAPEPLILPLGAPPACKRGTVLQWALRAWMSGCSLRDSVSLAGRGDVHGVILAEPR